jgi:hypothetical protein
MVRLPVRGTTFSTPRRNEAVFRTVLVELCPERDFTQLESKAFYDQFRSIIGRWSAEQDRLDISPLVKTFTGMRKDLERILATLSGHDEGIHESHDIEVVSHLTSLLAADPEVGSRRQARKLIHTFRHDAAKLAHACLVAAHELDEAEGQRGRPRGDWYDNFTALLLGIANAADVQPSSGKDRVSGERVGWLMDAAEALESFLDPHMRSPSKEARSKRLERSLRTLRQAAPTKTIRR